MISTGGRYDLGKNFSQPGFDGGSSVKPKAGSPMGIST